MPMFNANNNAGAMATMQNNRTTGGSTPSGLTRLSPGVYRDAQGRLVNDRGQPINTGAGRNTGGNTGGNTGTGGTGSGTNPGAGSGDTNTGNGQKGFFANNPFGETALDAFNKFAEYYKGNNFDLQGAPPLPGANDFSADRKRIEDTLYQRATNDLDTRYKAETDQFEQNMANQGLDINNPRYQREKELFLKTRDQAYNDARFQSIKDAGTEQTQQFTNALDARKQAASEAEQSRSQRVLGLAALLNPTSAMQTMINQREMQKSQQTFEGKEGDKNRATQRSISGGGQLDLGALMKIVEQLTGSKLSG